MTRTAVIMGLAVVASMLALGACASDDDNVTRPPAAGGTAGTAGVTAKAGSAGTAVSGGNSGVAGDRSHTALAGVAGR